MYSRLEAFMMKPFHLLPSPFVMSMDRKSYLNKDEKGFANFEDSFRANKVKIWFLDDL